MDEDQAFAFELSDERDLSVMSNNSDSQNKKTKLNNSNKNNNNSNNTFKLEFNNNLTMEDSSENLFGKNLF